MKTDLFRRVLLPFALYLIIAIIGLIVFDHHFDGNYVVYRFASHLHSGQGLIYGTAGDAQEAVVSTYPVAPLLLSLGMITSIPVETVSQILLVISLAIGGVFLFRITRSNWIVGLFYVLIGAILPSLPAAILLALAFAALDSARCSRWILSGLLVAMGILTSPLAIILGLLTLLIAVRTPGAIWRYLLPAALIPALAFLSTRLSLGSNVSLVSLLPSGLIIVLALATVILLVVFRRAEQRSEIAMLAAWLTLCAFVVFLSGGVINFPTATTADLAGQREAGQWIAENTDASDTLATAYVGTLAYRANRSVIDMSGQLQPIPFDKDFFVRTAPDAIVLDTDQPVPWDNFKTTYANVHSVGSLTIYHRVVNFSALDNHALNLVYTGNLSRDDLKLMNVAVAETAHPGDLVRVRLDWHLAYTPSYDVTIRLVIMDVQGRTVANIANQFPAAFWHTGNISTYHLIALPNKIDPVEVRPLTMKVGVGIRSGDLGEQTVSKINVTK